MTSTDSETPELDVRAIPKPERHPLIFDRFMSLPAGGSFVLVNSHDPKHLRQEFDRDHAGTYDWQYLQAGPTWQIRITRLSTTELPSVLGDVSVLLRESAPADATGAIWKLLPAQRDLDANVIRLLPDGRIEPHQGPDLDVLLYVVEGTGELTHELGTTTLTAGAIVWLPRRSQRSITAGSTGLSYLSVHPRRPALTIGVGSSQAG